jgi:hypothetical protein
MTKKVEIKYCYECPYFKNGTLQGYEPSCSHPKKILKNGKMKKCKLGKKPFPKWCPL